MAVSIMQNDHEIQIPRVWFFPTSRLNRALRSLDGYQVIQDIDGIYTRVRKDAMEIARYSTPTAFSGYYPRFEMIQQDETLKQAVAPYVMFVKRK